MPRHREPSLTAQWHHRIDLTTAGAIDHLLTSPRTNRPVYAARSILANRLLEAWVAAVAAGRTTIDIPSVEELVHAKRRPI